MKTKILTVEKYSFGGKEYRDLREIKGIVEDAIGKIIDSTPDRLPANMALQIFEAIVKNKADLAMWLSIEFEVPYNDYKSFDYKPETKNILDL